MDEVEEIKHRIDLVEFISTYLTLKKAGANYKAVCPFHSEKTPSLMVSPEKQIWKCFGCSEGGDVFSFVMKMENLEFREALEMLADRAGVKLERKKAYNAQDNIEKDQKTRLFQINKLSSQVFHKILMEHPAGKVGLDYLLKRGITKETMKLFQIGYAPQGRFLQNFLTKKGFSQSEITNAGGPDRFYKRIIFPIRDVMGNVLGFTGRVLDPKQEPKYLNTPETIIFHKGRILYNLDLARGEIKTAKTTVVVEGQMDVISSYQAGVKNVVASSGTALTPEHLLILYRYTPNIVFSFDSDTAGMTTAKKAYEMAITAGMNAKMVQLISPAGEFKDPGEMIEKDPKLWQTAVMKAEPVIDWYFELAFGKMSTADRLPASPAGGPTTAVEKKEIAREILPIIKKIPDTIEQAHYVDKLAQKLDIDQQVIFDALGKVDDKDTPRQSSERVNNRKPLSNDDLLLGILISAPQLIEEVQTNIKAEDLIEKSNQLLYTTLKNWYNDNSKANSATADLLKFLAKSVPSAQLEKIKATVFAVENDYPQEELNSSVGSQIVSDVIAKIKRQKKEAIKHQFAKMIKVAEEKGDKEKLKALIKEFQDAIE